MASVTVDGTEEKTEEEQEAPELVVEAEEADPVIDPAVETTVETIVEEAVDPLAGVTEKVTVDVDPDAEIIPEVMDEPSVFDTVPDDVDEGVGVFDKPIEVEYTSDEATKDIDGFEDENATILREKRLARTDALRQEAVETTVQPDGSETPVVEDDDSWGISFVKTLYDVPLTIAFAAPRVLNETAMAIDDLLETANRVIPEDVKAVMGYNLATAGLIWFMENAENTDPAQIPVRDPTTAAGRVLAPISDFVVGLIPALRAAKLATAGVKLASGANALAMAGRAGVKAAEYTGASAITNFFVWDPHEANFASLLNDTEVFGQDLSGVWTEMLATDPNDSDLLNRTRNVVEGLLMDLALLGTGKAIVGTTKGVAPVVASGFKNVAAVKPIAAMLTASMDLMRKTRFAAGYTGAPVDMLSDDGISYVARRMNPDVPAGGVAQTAEEALRVVPEAIEAAFRAGRISIGKVLEHVNFTGFRDGKSISDTLDAFTTGMFKQVDEIKLRLEAEGKPTSGVISDPELQSLADSLNITPEKLMSRTPGSVTTEELVAAGEMMLNATRKKMIQMGGVAKDSTDTADLWEFAKMQNIYKAMNIQVEAVRGQQGRGLRAVDAFSDRISEGAMAQTDTFLDRMRWPEGNADQQREMLTNGALSQGNAWQIRKLAKLVSEGSDEAFDKIQRGPLQTRIMDALIEWQYFAYLSGIPTLNVNMMGTVASVAWNIPERMLSAQAGRARRALTGSDEGVAIGEATAMAKGLVESVYNAYRAAAKTYRTGSQEVVHSKIESRVNSAINADALGFASGASGELNVMQKGWNKGLDAIGYIVSRPGRFLQTTDEFLGSIAKDQSMNALAFRQATKEGLEGPAFAQRMADIRSNPSKWMTDQSLELARATTFTTDLGKFGKLAQQMTNVVPILKLVVPFVRTPTNLLKWAGVRSPLGWLAGSVRADLLQGGAKADMAIGRMASGSMLMVGIANETWEGNITAGGPIDPKLRETWLRDNKIPYGVKMPWKDENGGDVWYSYKRWDPFGVMIGASAGLAEVAAAVSEGDLDEWGTAIMMAASRDVYNKTWLTGAGDLFKMLMTPEYTAEDYAASTLSSFLVPAIVRTVKQTVDPVWRDAEGFGDSILASIPGFSTLVAADRNLWGIPVHSATVGPAFLSPIAMSSVDARAIDHWLWENGIVVNKPQDTQRFLSSTGLTVGIKLTAWQKDRFLELSGNVSKDKNTGLGFYDTVSALMDGTHRQSSKWERANTAGREAVFRAIMGAFRAAARIQLLSEDEDLRALVDAAGVVEFNRLTE